MDEKIDQSKEMRRGSGGEEGDGNKNERKVLKIKSK